MAKGIIIAKPDVGKPGTIISVDTTYGDPGTRYSFSSATALNLGDLVEFTLSSAGTVTLASVIQKGQSILSPVSGDITIASGKSCLISGTTVTGNVNNNGGYLCIVNSATITGTLNLSANSLVISNGATINNAISSIYSGSTLVMNTSSAKKGIRSSGNQFVKIQSCTITGDLSVTGASTCKCSGNIVSGTTNTPGCSTSVSA